MDKFEKRLNQVNMVTPKSAYGATSNVKQTDPGKSYASLNEFSKINQLETYDNEVVNLKSQVQILEGKLVFYDREFQIKQQSLEKRIQQLIQTCSQLTQQNTQLRLQYQSLMSEYQQLQEQYVMQEKSAQNYEEKVKAQLEGVQKFTAEKEQYILYANKCRERSKQRKQKIKDLNILISEMQAQQKQLERENEVLKTKNEAMLQQFNLQIADLQEKNEEWQLKYTQLLQNVKNHLTEEDQHSEISQNNQVITLDEKHMATLQDQLDYYGLFEKDIHNLLVQMSNYSAINEVHYENPQVRQLAQIFNRMVDKIVDVSDKKKRLKEQAKEMEKQLLLLQQQLQQSQQSPYNSVNSQPQDQQQKYLFERRILELEQYYQKDKKRSATNPQYKDQRQGMIVRMQNQFLNEFINYTVTLRELNYQLNEVQSEPFKKRRFSMRRYAYVVIALHRLERMASGCLQGQFIVHRKLKVVMPIITTMQYLLELLQTQQQLIDTMQTAVDQQRQRDSDTNLIASDLEVPAVVDSELREQVKLLQQEIDVNTKKMMEYKQKTEKIIEEKDNLICSLERDYQSAKEEQWERVKMIEQEFLQMSELVEQLQQL